MRACSLTRAGELDPAESETELASLYLVFRPKLTIAAFGPAFETAAGEIDPAESESEAESL